MKALVTGGGGFVGSALVRRLLSDGHAVRNFSRSHYPQLEALGAESVQGDLTDPDAVKAATRGCEVVFHVAAKVGGWGDPNAYRQTNVGGTKNIIEACRAHGVSKLVFTSTPSVVHTGADIEGADESLPYATHFSADYPKTKAEAERLVLQANDEQLATVALRPHLVWGPGDQHLLPRLLDRARAGRLRIVGTGKQRVDMTYIDNVVDAHMGAMEHLSPGAACAGRAYFIAQDEPAEARQLINAFLDVAGMPPEQRRIPAWLAWTVGAAAEAVYRLLGRKQEPPLTRFAAEQLATAHWFDLSAARRDIGYRPSVSTAEGLERLRAHLHDRGTNS